MGALLFLWVLITLPVAILEGIIYPRLVIRKDNIAGAEEDLASEEARQLPSTAVSFMVVLPPVFL